ncbi:MAG: DEAD/DEAH box helicase [Rikenellaceae bacterium]
MKFEDLGINSSFTERIEKLNISQPTPIQELVISKVLNNSSIVATSQTGSGKTLAYLLPLVQLLTQKGGRGKLLVLVPTRELAQQVGEVCAFLCESTSLKHVVIYGGVEYEPQIEGLKVSDIVIATPGRLIDILDQKVIELNDLAYFVLDEVDQMLDLGFLEPIKLLAQLRTKDTISLCFSATMTEVVKSVIAELCGNIEHLAVENQRLAVENIEQVNYFVEKSMMDSLLLHLLHKENPSQSVIFTRSRNMADRLVEVLSMNGLKAEAMHSDKSQAAREHIIARFKSLETVILVATDVIARGIDIDTITHVFNYGLPQSPEQYIHRIGRTGRAGRSGKAISLTCPTDKLLLESICKLMKQNIPTNSNHPYMTLGVMKALESQGDAKGTKGRPKKKRR